MLRTLPHILSRVFGPPLLIAPTPLEALLSGLHAALLHRGSLIEPQAFAGDKPDQPTPVDERPRGYSIDRGVATVPIHGVLVRRAGMIDTDSTPLQSYENVGRVLRKAQRDSRVRSILLDIDSPGGEAGGVFDLAGEIRHAAEAKPLWAIANDDALSAAYVLASGAQRIYATQTASLGSLGVVALHADQSAFDAKEGLHYTYVFRGAHKIDAHPHGALSSEAQLAIQSEVDRIYDKLVSIVATHRHTDAARIRGTEAALYFGERALEQGLADRIGTFDEAHAALVEHTTTQQRGPTRMDATERPPAETTTETTKPAAVLDNNVVQLRVTEAETATRLQAREIAELCSLAGYPALAAEFIGQGATSEVVRKALQERKAADATKHAVVSIDASREQRQMVTSAELGRVAAERFKAQSRAYTE